MLIVGKLEDPMIEAMSVSTVPRHAVEIVTLSLRFVDGEGLFVPESETEAVEICAAAEVGLNEELTPDALATFEVAMAARPPTIASIRASIPWSAWRCAVHVGLCCTLYPEIALSKDEQSFLDALVEGALP